jgi:predicted small lipoprotein YifL
MLDFMRFLLLAVSLCLGVAGCGQKGALYLRDNPPAGVKAPKTDPYRPVPYPKEEQKDADRERADQK